MDYRTLTPTGLEVSSLCLGTWRFGHESDGKVEINREQSHRLLDAAWDLGINFIDTANRYGTPCGTSETYIGEWIQDVEREAVVIASKVCLPMGDHPNNEGLSRKHIRHQIDETLERLGTDYLDIYYIHRWDERTPIEETLSVLDDLIREGKVDYIGASSMASWQFCKALWKSEVYDLESFRIAQPPLDATRQSYDEFLPYAMNEYLDLCEDQNLAVCPYSPLAGGFLTGKYSKDGMDDDGSRRDREAKFDDWYVSERSWHVLDAVEAVAEEVGATLAQVALRWLIDLNRFTTVPVVGARTVKQLKENAGTVDVSLSDEQHDRITNVE